MSVTLKHGPQGSGKTTWANSQASERTRVVLFTDAYERCRSGRFAWKPRPAFFKAIGKGVSTLIFDDSPPLHQVKYANVYHSLWISHDVKRVYLSQHATAHLLRSVNVEAFEVPADEE